MRGKSGRQSTPIHGGVDAEVKDSDRRRLEDQFEKVLKIKRDVNDQAKACLDKAAIAGALPDSAECKPIIQQWPCIMSEDKMTKTEEVVQHDFASVRTGKASPALVENIMVEVYGSNMRLREVAGITTPEARMLVIQPWDTGSLHPIEKAIQKANIGLNPSIHGKLIRLVMPELSEERRHEFVKLAHKMSTRMKS